MQTQQPSSNQQPILNPQLIQFIQSHRLLKIYQKIISSLPTQNERIDKIKNSINTKISTTDTTVYDLLQQLKEVIQINGANLAKSQLLQYLAICRELVSYKQQQEQVTVDSNSPSTAQKHPTQLPNKTSKQCMILTTDIELQTVKMLYFVSQTSRTKDQAKQLKFQYKSLILELLGEVISFFWQNSDQERVYEKELQFLEFISSNDIVERLVGSDTHVQIMRKALILYFFAVKYQLVRCGQFLDLVRSMLHKSIQHKRLAEQMLEMAVLYKFQSWKDHLTEFAIKDLLHLQPQKIQTSTISFLSKFIKAFQQRKQQLFLDPKSQQKIFLIISLLKQLSNQKTTSKQIKDAINQLYYQSVSNIFSSPAIRQKFLGQFCEYLNIIQRKLQQFSYRQYQIDGKGVGNEFIVRSQENQLSKQIVSFVKEFAEYVCTFKYDGDGQNVINERSVQIEGIKRPQVCQFLLENKQIDQKILTCIILITSYQQKTKQQGPLNKCLSKLLSFFKFIVTQGQTQDQKVKSYIQSVFQYLNGTIQFLQWILEFTVSLQNQFFSNIFKKQNANISCYFKNINERGFSIILRKYYQINYNNNNYLVSFYDPECGIRFMMKKSQKFSNNFQTQNIDIMVDQNDLLEQNKIFQMIPINEIIQNLEGTSFLILLGCFSESTQIKNKAFSLFAFTKCLANLSQRLIIQSQEKYVRSCYDRLSSILQQQVIYQRQAEIRGLIGSLNILIQITQAPKPQRTTNLRFNQLKTTDYVRVDFYVIDQASLLADCSQVRNFGNVDFSKMQANKLSVVVNSSSTLKQCFKKVAQQLTNNQNQAYQFQNEYICLQVNHNYSITQPNKKTIDYWLKINHFNLNQFFLIKKDMYKLMMFGQEDQRQKLNIAFYLSQRFFNVYLDRQKDMFKSIQKIAQIWREKENYQENKHFLQHLIKNIYDEKIRSKYFLVKFMFGSLEQQPKFKKFIYQLFNLLKKVQVHPKVYTEQFQSCRNIFIQNQDYYNLIFQLYDCKIKTSQCQKSVKTLLQTLSPLKSIYQDAFINNISTFYGVDSYFIRTYILRVSLHKLIISTQNVSQWKRHSFMLNFFKQLVSTVQKQKSSERTQLIYLLIQHIVVDFSSQQINSQLNKCVSNLGVKTKSNQIMEIDTSSHQQEIKKYYPLKIIQEIYYKDFLLFVQDVTKEIKEEKVLQSVLIVFWQYVNFPHKQNIFFQLFVFGIQKLLLSQQRKISQFTYPIFVYFLKQKQLLKQNQLQNLIQHFSDKLKMQLEISLSKSKQHKLPQSSQIYLKMIKLVTLDQLKQYSLRYKNQIMSQMRYGFLQYILGSLQQQLNLLPSQKTQTLSNHNLHGNSLLRQLLINCLKQIYIIITNFNIISENIINWKCLSSKLFTQQPSNINNNSTHNNNIISYLSPQVRSITYDILLQITRNSSYETKHYLIYRHIYPLLNKLQSINTLQNKQITFKNKKVGLVNQGNTCYMNSLLQVLFNIKQFSQDIVFNLPLNNQVQSVRQLNQMFTYLTFSQTYYYNPINFVLSIQDKLNIADQQDTTEFFHVLQNQLQKANKNKLFKQKIQGHTSSTIQCQKCQYKKIKKQVFLIYDVEVENVDSLQKALRNMARQEIISDYICSNCKERSNVKKTNVIQSTSDMFFIQLKRIKYDYSSLRSIKLHHRLVFSQILDLNQIYSQQNDQNQLYQLSGIIVHRGTGQLGHYFSYVKDSQTQSQQKWHCYDDTNVSQVSKEEFLERCYGDNKINNDSNSSENAYILVYKRKTGSNETRTKRNQVQIQVQSHFLRQKSNKLIQNIKQQNQLRTLAYILLQTDLDNNHTNMFIKFLSNLLKINSNTQINPTIYNYIQFGIKLIILLKISDGQFILYQAVDYLRSNSHEITYQIFKRCILNSDQNFQAIFLADNQTNKAKQYFLTQIFGIIFTTCWTRYFCDSKKMIQNQVDVVNRKQISQISQQIHSFFVYLLCLVQKYLSNLDRNAEICLFNLLKLLNGLIDQDFDRINQNFYGQISTFVEIRQLLLRFVNFNFYEIKIDLQIIRFVGSLMRRLRGKQKQKFSKLSQEPKQMSEQVGQRMRNQNIFQLGDHFFFAKQGLSTQILVSNGFWTKTIGLIQKFTNFSQFRRLLLPYLQPILSYSLSNSLTLRKNLRTFIITKINPHIQTLTKQISTIPQNLTIWFNILKTTLLSELEDQIIVNSESLIIDSQERNRLIQQTFSQILRFTVDNFSYENHFMHVLQDLQEFMQLYVDDFLVKYSNINDNGSIKEMRVCNDINPMTQTQGNKNRLEIQVSFSAIKPPKDKQFKLQLNSNLNILLSLISIYLDITKQQLTLSYQQRLSTQNKQTLSKNQAYIQSTSTNIGLKLLQTYKKNTLIPQFSQVNILSQNQNIIVQGDGECRNRQIRGGQFVVKVALLLDCLGCLKGGQSGVRGEKQSTKLQLQQQVYSLGQKYLQQILASILSTWQQIGQLTLKIMPLITNSPSNLAKSIQISLITQNYLIQQPLKTWTSQQIQNQQITCIIKLIKIKQIKQIKQQQKMIQIQTTNERQFQTYPWLYMFTLQISINQLFAYSIGQVKLLVSLEYVTRSKGKTQVIQIQVEKDKQKMSQDTVKVNIYNPRQTGTLLYETGSICLEVDHMDKNPQIQIQQSKFQQKSSFLKPLQITYSQGKITAKICYKRIFCSDNYQELQINSKVKYLTCKTIQS